MSFIYSEETIKSQDISRSENRIDEIRSPYFPEVVYKPRPPLVSYPEGNYKATTPEARMIQMSMKFIPLANHEPKDTDEPYLFKIQSQPLPYVRQSKKPKKKSTTGLAISLGPEPEGPTPSTERLGLRCPKNGTPLLIRAHENFVMAYIDFHNHKVDVQREDEMLESGYTPSSCPACCRLPRRPKEIEKKTPRELYQIPPDYDGPVPFFPDFRTIFGGDLPEGALVGWMDSNGVFHLAEMGDPLPPDAMIGYLDKDGVFYPIISVKEGVKHGLVGVRMANGEIGAYPGNPRLAFMPEIVAYSDNTGNLFYKELDGEFGYLDLFDTFHELPRGESLAVTTIRAFRSKVDGSIISMAHHLPPNEEIPVPSGAILGWVDNEGEFIPEISGSEPEGWTLAYLSNDEEVVLISLPESDLDWLDRLPEGAVGGYLDENGVFHPLKKGQTVPPGGIYAYQSADGKIIPIKLANQIPKNSVAGYIDENGVFHELKAGDELPPGAKLSYLSESGDIQSMLPVPGYIDADGVFHEFKEGEEGIIPPGGFPAFRAADGSIFQRHSTFSYPPGSTSGYIDSYGVFHELADGEEVPPGGIPAYRATDGSIIPQISSHQIPKGSVLGYVDEYGAFHELKEGEELPRGSVLAFMDSDGKITPTNGGEGGGFGYIDEFGVFHELKEGEELPPGSVLAVMDPSGKIMPANGGEGGSFGYIDEFGVFHELKEGEELPPGSVLAFMDSNGKIMPANGEGGGFGYIDANGVFHDLEPGKTPPPGTVMAYMNSDGKVVLIGSDELKGAVAGYIDENGEFHELKKGEELPPGATLSYRKPDGSISSLSPRDSGLTAEIIEQFLSSGAQMSYMDENGVIHKLGPGEVPPPGAVLGFVGPDNEFHALPQGSEIGYIDKDGKFVPLEPGASPPPGMEVGYRGADGVFKALTHSPSLNGYIDADGIFRELKPGEEMPEGVTSMEGVMGYLDKDGNFHTLKEGESLPEGAILVFEDRKSVIPEGGRPSYRDSDGVIHYLEDGKNPPKGSLAGWVDKNGVFHPLGNVEEEGSAVDLRSGEEMTEEERKAFDAFKQSLGVQCALEYVEGSLDLGEVHRKTFRIYSHGASVDIDLKPEPSHQSHHP